MKIFSHQRLLEKNCASNYSIVTEKRQYNSMGVLIEGMK